MDILEQTVAKADTARALKRAPRNVEFDATDDSLHLAICPGTPAFKDDYWRTAPTLEPIDFKVKTSSRVPLPPRATVAPALVTNDDHSSCGLHGGSPPLTGPR
eukprot:1233872-Prymnesium_polylepis.1